MTSGVIDSCTTDGSSVGALLCIRGLTVDYTAGSGSVVHALRQMNLTVAEQETVGVLGESGSGKSSLAQAILQLLPGNASVTGGKIEYRGRNLLRLPAKDLRSRRGAEIALISQEPALALNPVLPIGRQIADVLRAHRKPSRNNEVQKKASNMLAEVGFTDPERIMRAYPHQLSGGQRQRAAIAQALICGPALLIADEPLSSLDTITQAEILELLQRLKRELKLAMIFITHNAGVLASLADRVAVMHQGEVRACGALGTLSSHPDPYVRGLISPEKSLATISSQPAMRDAAGSVPFVQVSNLSKQFVQRRPFSRKFTVRALQGIDLELEEGGTVAIIGRSGSGKSTLARCIAGFETPDEGEILLQGAAKRGLDRQVQLIFQDAGAALNPRFSAWEIVAEPLEITGEGSRRERRERALQLMEEVGLDRGWQERSAQEFSGGQRQRLAIARALAANPKLLIFDESFSGLDLPLQAQMLRLLMDLQTRHALTYLHISHDLNFISFFAQQVVVMDEGKIVERANPAALAESSSPATRRLVQASERLQAPGLEAVL